jgi:hypothetical protein
MKIQVVPIVFRKLYIIRWDKPSQILTEEIEVKSKLVYARGLTSFTPSEKYKDERDYRVPIIIQANLFGEDFIGDKVQLVSSQEIETEINPDKSVLGQDVKKIKHCEMLILAPPGSRSLFWVYKYPSCRKSAFCLSLGLPTQKGLSNNTISVEIKLEVCN